MMLARYGLENVDPNAEAGRLSIAVRQMVAIVRAVSQDARIVIMDEPTSSLESSEVDRPTRGIDVGAKFEIQSRLSDLAAGGMAVLIISSELEEVLEGLAAARLGDVLALGRRGSEPAPARSPARPRASLIGP